MSDSLPTPGAVMVDFCLLPIGTGSPSISKTVADVELILQSSGLKHSMHSAGTTVEGPWDKVWAVIGHIHTKLHENGVLRIQTTARIGTRIDKEQTMEDKVNKVNTILKE